MIVKLFWHPHARHAPSADWSIIEVPFDTLQDLVDDLHFGGIVVGDLLYTRKGHDGTWLITSSETTAFSLGGVDRVEEAKGEYARMSGR